MKSALSIAVAGSAAAALSGCGTELGLGGGRQLKDPHWVGTGHLAMSTKPFSTPINQRGILVGTELGARAEEDVGSRWTLGVLVGHGVNPEPRPWNFGYELHLDVGAPLGGGGFAPDRSFYAGGTAAGVIWVSSPHELSDMNRSSWFFKRTLELVPYVRFRAHFDRPCMASEETRLDVIGGAALRLRLVNDFL